nr:phage holin [Lactobacillus delbrueckii]
MTVKDWVYLAMTIGGYLVAMIAGLYAKDKGKINKATAAGKAMDVVGKLATYAVHEADHVDTSNEAKRKYAVEVVAQGLSWLGIKDVTPIVINGAVEDAVNAMHLANSQQAVDQPAETKQQAVDQPAETKEVTNGK